MITNYMRLALEQAFYSIGVSRPNPAVGAVVVKDGIVVGKGRTQSPGNAHAEVMALRDAGEFARGAAIFVTLEPCCHYGRTPPCTKAIIDAGIAKVFFAHADPNPLVRGKSRKVLEEAGIEVHEGVEACIAAGVEEIPEECADSAGDGCRVFGYGAKSAQFINVPSEMEIEGRSVFAEIEHYFEAYDYFVTNKKTFVEVKSAVSESGFIAGIGPDGTKFPLKITGQGANCWNHELRAMSDAILVGAGTLLVDNPSLTVRLAAGNNPVKVVWAGHHVFTAEEISSLKIFDCARDSMNGRGTVDAGNIVDIRNAVPQNLTLVYSLVEQPALASFSQAPASYPQSHVSIEILRLSGKNFADAWREMLADMARRGMHRLMVEPGARLASLLFESEGDPLWNRLDLWRSTDPSADAPEGLPLPPLPKACVARESAMIGPDVLTVYYPLA